MRSPRPSLALVSFHLLALSVGIVLSGCDANGNSGQNVQHSVLVDGGNRFFELHIPKSATPEASIPLVIAFHGAGGSGPGFQEFARLDGEADKRGFLVAYPSATGVNWAEGCNCTRPDIDGVDDIGFVDNLIARVDQDFNIDTSKIYAIGYSQGALFTHRLACERSETFAGSAMVSGMMSIPVATTCAPAGAQDIMMMHGENDDVLPWTGVPSGLYATLSVLDTFFFWRSVSDCTEVGIPQETRTTHSVTRTVRTVSSCREGSRLRLDEIKRGGHDWPKFAAEEILDFFGL